LIPSSFECDCGHQIHFGERTVQEMPDYPHEKSLALALQIHTAGRGIIWAGALEVAELKRDQLRSAGPDFAYGNCPRRS
jgi:ATP-dependent Clp protease adaptor protein ClpS